MDIDLRECIGHQIKMGKDPEEYVNIDRYAFHHPNYFLYHEDRFIGYLYSEYKDAFIVFDIINN